MSLSNAAAATPSREFPASQVVNRASNQTDDRRDDADHFVDRRRGNAAQGGSERRQFGSSHNGLSQAGRELAFAIDQYKLQHHRRYITCDEMLHVITDLGYSK